MTVSVLVVEDEPAFLQRFSQAVLGEPQLRLVGAVSSVAAGKALIAAERPDVVLTDLGLPDGSGIEIIRHAMACRPDCDVLVVTMFGDDAHVTDSIAAGATGYLMKDALPASVAAAVLDVRAGGAPISPGIARRVLQRFRDNALQTGAGTPAATGSPAAAAPADSPLTERETEILRLVAKGLNFADVGGVLGISAHTVVTHVKRIYRKLAVHSRGEAVYEAQVLGLL
ncbi:MULTISPECIES: response regulator transcription factor [Ramlibacter]|uniref:Response regulator transcription factor n=1 Tax=Ramlibacter aquaticus TaxID=2780094 RepID=A0ABR9SAY6_9BURK|nr:MULTISPECIES: response regulator transcription factor [Ramlibacter]MBE7939522.1 response regulator transcription factor [Ramlibacter aquaticus]